MYYHYYYYCLFFFISHTGRVLYSPLLLVTLAPLSNVAPCTQASAEWGWRNSLTILTTGEKAKSSQVEIIFRGRYLVWGNKKRSCRICICSTFGLRRTLDCRTSEIEEQRRSTQTLVSVVFNVVIWNYMMLFSQTRIISRFSLQSRYLLLKEKNMLLTIEQEAKRQRVPMPSSERLKKVKSCCHIVFVSNAEDVSIPVKYGFVNIIFNWCSVTAMCGHPEE